MKYKPSSALTRIDSSNHLSRPQTQTLTSRPFQISTNSRAQTSELRRRTFKVMNLGLDSVNSIKNRPSSYNKEQLSSNKNKKEIRLHKLSMGLQNFGSMTDDNFKNFAKLEINIEKPEINIFEELALTSKEKFKVKELSYDSRKTMLIQKANRLFPVSQLEGLIHSY